MNDFKDIDRNDELSQLFQQNANQLEEKPSINAWDRVERKLETRRLRRRTIMYRYSSLAAAAIGVFALIMAVRLINTVERIADSAEGQAIAKEELPLTEDEKKIAEAIKFHREEQRLQKEEFSKLEKDKKSKEITTSDDDEFVVLPDGNGSYDRKNADNKPPAVIVQPEAPQPNAPDEEPIADADVYIELEEVEEEAPADDIFIEKDKARAKKVADAKKEKESYKPQPKVEKKDNASPVVVAPKRNNSAINKKDISLNTNTSGKRVEIQKEEAGELDVVQNSSKNYEEKAKAKKQSTKFKTYSNASALNDFAWLKGDWTDAASSTSSENWSVVNSELLGEGYIMVDGKKQFAEYMKIYKKGKNIYFKGSIDNSKKFKTFKFKRWEGKQAIFERKSRKFPNQVIITKGSNTYNIVYKNKKATSINDEQSDYFRNRNSISTERVARSMRRKN